jgi:hypothetical protein
MDTEPPSSAQNSISRNSIIIGILVALIVVMSSILVLLYLRTRNTAPQQTGTEPIPTIISGSFDINGIAPDGSSISLIAKDLSGGKTQVVASGIAPTDEGTWSFDKAVPGKSYVLQGDVMMNGKSIAQSDPITITAPAGQETITFNLPSNTHTPDAVISGNVVVNGYIPAGATINIQGRKLGDQAFTRIASNLPGQPRQFMNYTSAMTGTTYEIMGILYDANGTNIGTSSILTVDAPALNETITINSTAHAPAVITLTPTPRPTLLPTTTPHTSQNPTPTATPTPEPATPISGTIDFNGVAPANSRIVIFEKVYDTQSYHVAVDNIVPSDGITWTWQSPQPSTWYDIIAVLKQKQNDGTDKDIAVSSVSSVAAPATNVTLTINSGISLSAPTGAITVSCNTLSGTDWSVKVTFSGVTGAGSYWYQVGTTDGGRELVNSTQNASSNSDLIVPLQFVRGTRYYARYAYASLANQNANSSQFSPFTSTTPLQCN